MSITYIDTDTTADISGLLHGDSAPAQGAAL